MADIIFKYTDMENAARKIDALAEQYKKAATDFNSDFNAAIVGWEGTSKDKMKNFINGSVKDYTDTTVPGLLTALAALLRENAKQMSAADDQIAQNIPGK